VILLARVLQGGRRRAAAPLPVDPAGKFSTGEAVNGDGRLWSWHRGGTGTGTDTGRLLTDTFSWRYAFYINIPVGILAVVLIAKLRPRPALHQECEGRAFDNIGFGLLIVWTGCLQVVLDKGRRTTGLARFGCAWRWSRSLLR